ncbi:MAG: hypothetical protein JW810_11835, partial [Sedimentisphaerales bacterium]|nr:hypothetical protein [Sedimentisphaerales bacterium]
MNAPKPKRNKKWSRTLILFAIPIVLISVLAVVWAQMNRQQSGEKEAITFDVRRGDLVISVTESGNIQARESVDLLCEVEGRTTIISVVPEGTV